MQINSSPNFRKMHMQRKFLSKILNQMRILPNSLQDLQRFNDMHIMQINSSPNFRKMHMQRKLLSKILNRMRILPNSLQDLQRFNDMHIMQRPKHNNPKRPLHLQGRLFR
jgi:hypothetical protein